MVRGPETVGRGLHFIQQYNLIKPEQKVISCPVSDQIFKTEKTEMCFPATKMEENPCSPLAQKNIYMFDINPLETYENAAMIPIPIFIMKTLTDQKDMKAVRLGCEKPIGTLLDVLQVKDDDGVRTTFTEITQSACHCP